MAQLSPLTTRNILATSYLVGEPAPTPTTPPPADEKAAVMAWARPFRRYRCPACDEVHDSHHRAEECCKPEPETVYVGPDGTEYGSAAALADAIRAGSTGGPAEDATRCPVCGADHGDEQDAADCCLWKDLAPAQRFTVAMAVMRGSTWADAIAAA